jgi:cytochrome c-type biogenesis protein CcmH/NrfG
LKAESFVFAIAGTFFGIIVGWILGSQQATSGRVATAPVAQQAPAASTANNAAPPQLDQERVQALKAVAEQNPRDAEPRVQLANMYFDAERYTDAITWYEAAIALKPGDPNLSTDLGVAYYYTNQPDRAIAQFQRSLAADPKHTKTLLNMGIVKAFGKQDLAGAAAAWEQVIAIAPNSPEGQAANKALEGLRNAHPATKPDGTGGGQ